MVLGRGVDSSEVGIALVRGGQQGGALAQGRKVGRDGRREYERTAGVGLTL